MAARDVRGVGPLLLGDGAGDDPRDGRHPARGWWWWWWMRSPWSWPPVWTDGRPQKARFLHEHGRVTLWNMRQSTPSTVRSSPASSGTVGSAGRSSVLPRAPVAQRHRGSPPPPGAPPDHPGLSRRDRPGRVRANARSPRQRPPGSERGQRGPLERRLAARLEVEDVVHVTGRFDFVSRSAAPVPGGLDDLLVFMKRGSAWPRRRPGSCFVGSFRVGTAQ